MAVPDGEVAVRQNGHTHAVQADRLEGTVTVDVDHEVVHLPTDIGAVYHDDQLADTGEGDDEAMTDGGHATQSRTEVEMEGFGLDGEQAGWSLVGAGFGLATSGYLWGLPSEATQMAALIAFCVSAGIGYIGVRSAGGGQGA